MTSAAPAKASTPRCEMNQVSSKTVLDWATIINRFGQASPSSVKKIGPLSIACKRASRLLICRIAHGAVAASGCTNLR